jgi:hypothetical protein
MPPEVANASVLHTALSQRVSTRSPTEWQITDADGPASDETSAEAVLRCDSPRSCSLVHAFARLRLFGRRDGDADLGGFVIDMLSPRETRPPFAHTSFHTSFANSWRCCRLSAIKPLDLSWTGGRPHCIFAVPGLLPASRHLFRVTVFNEAGASLPSAPNTVTVPVLCDVPDAPYVSFLHTLAPSSVVRSGTGERGSWRFLLLPAARLNLCPALHTAEPCRLGVPLGFLVVFE